MECTAKIGGVTGIVSFEHRSHLNDSSLSRRWARGRWTLH